MKHATTIQDDTFTDNAQRDWNKPTYAELESRIAARNSIILALGAAVLILCASLVVILSMI